MKRRFLCATLAGLWLVGMISPQTRAADRDRRRVEQARNEVYRVLPVDSMIQQAAENVARRYNLNPEQTAFTRDMMTKRVNRFLQDHEDEIWPIVRDLARYSSPNRKMPPKLAQRVGEAIRPLFEEAQKAILEANSEWRDILSDEQKKLHDYDLREMRKTFKDLDHRFESWEKGKVARGDGIWPERRPDTPPVDPRMPKVTEQSAEKAIAGNIEWWDGYVEAFIKNYELDDGQINSANAILRELKQRAKTYDKKRAGDYARLKAQMAEAEKNKDKDRLKQLQAEYKELNLYKTLLFQELKDRLDKLPRPAQREKYLAKSQDFKWKDRPIGTPVDENKTKGTAKEKEKMPSRAKKSEKSTKNEKPSGDNA